MECLNSYIDRNANRYVETLKKFCNQPSISARKEGIQECVNMLQGMMEHTGISTRVVLTQGNPVVYGELKTAKKTAKTLMFYNHYDVQPPEPLEEWVSDPFSAEVRQGRIYARGVADNKGNVVARLKAVDAILKTVGEIPLNLKFIIEGEEEVSSPHLVPFLKENKDELNADGCIWEGGWKDVNGRPIIWLGVKGILYVELKTKEAKSDLHSMWSPIVRNPAWRLIWALKTLKDEKGRVTVNGFYDDVKEPSLKDRALLQDIPFNQKRYRELFGVKAFLNNLSGVELVKKLLFQPECTICGLDSGYKGLGAKTVLPSQATAKVDFRLVIDQSPDDIFHKLQTHLKKHGFGDVELIKHGQMEPAKSPVDADICRVVIETARKTYGFAPVVYPTIQGSGPMYPFVEWLGIPTVGTGVENAASNPHGPNENIKIIDYIQGIKHIASIIQSF